ncbi:MAG: protein kinase [Gemmataceae bacterium]|nr:protein kinase [Gemmataceae bacterium]
MSADPLPTPDAPGLTVPSDRHRPAPPPPPDPGEPTPQQVGGYRLVRLIGRGGMGEVWEADDPQLRRRVAVKLMLPAIAARPEARARFLREARALAAVRHDHVVPVLHVLEDGGVPYLVMPLLEGESLDGRLAGGPLPPGEVIRVGREAALGLAAAHAEGVVHRDIKPHNLWLEAPAGRVKLLDFGLARAVDPADGLSTTGAASGTPAYMAPEQADGQDPDPRADLFGLGAVLYRAATGTPAFGGRSATAILTAVASHHPPPPHEVNPAVPRGLSGLIMRLLEKDPARRPAGAGAVAVELAALAAEDTAPVDPDATTVPDRPAVRRGRRWVVPVVAAVAVLLGVGVWLGTRPGTRSAGEPVGDGGTGLPAGDPPAPAAPPRYRGGVEVHVEREAGPGPHPINLRVGDPGTLPFRKTDKFRVDAAVDPPAYLYVVWVDPGRDVIPVYPWDPAADEKVQWRTRPAAEKPTGRVSLPPNPADRFLAASARPGVVTIVVLARPTPLGAGDDDEVRGWFAGLPDLPLPAGGEGAAVWFDDYREVTAPGRTRSGFTVVGSADPFARWQGELKRAVGDKAAFQTAVSFARAGGN